SMSRTRVGNRFKNLSRAFHCGHSVWNGGADTRVIFGVEAINRSLYSRHVVLVWRSAVKNERCSQIRAIGGEAETLAAALAVSGDEQLAVSGRHVDAVIGHGVEI